MVVEDDQSPLGMTDKDKDGILEVQSCELAVMANLLVLKVYTPFLRHAAAMASASAAAGSSSSGLQLGHHMASHESSTSGFARTNSPAAAPAAAAAAMSSPASQATVHAAQAIIRAAKGLHHQASLSSTCVPSSSSTSTSTSTSTSKPPSASTVSANVSPVLLDLYPLDKVVFDAVVICAHAGLTGKASSSTFAFDGGALRDDVGVGLGILSELGATMGMGDAQRKVVEALCTRFVSRGHGGGGNGNGLKRKHDQHSVSMPAGSQQQQQQQPLMTSTPRPLPTAEAVMAYQQQQKQKLHGGVSTSGPPNSAQQSPSTTTTAGYEQEPNRARSSSFGQVHADQQQQQRQRHSVDAGSEDVQYPFFGTPTSSDMMNMHAMQRRRFSVDQQQQQQLSPEHPPYARHMFDQGQSQSNAMYDQTQSSYDAAAAAAHGSAGAAVDGMGYSAVSSPFSNTGAPTSASSSPFTTTSVASSGHPSTPTFPAHHPAPPVFGPQPPAAQAPAASPTTYFHTPSAFSGSYANTSAPSSSMASQQHHSGHSMSLGEMSLDQTMISIPGTPVFEKPHLHPHQHQHQATTMFDLKPGMDGHSQHHHQALQQQQHIQHQAMGASSYEDQDMPDQSHQLAMGMSVPSPWPSSGQQQQQQQPPPVQPFWNSGGGEYRFYS
ncbi:hypothetical protein BDZ97DRAFT_1814500 [Flammula alnicola]|nr:hypothetical protein BDZ97DRAFT_1814500 [Flammula alnicola]